MGYKTFDTEIEAKLYKHKGEYNKRKTKDGKWAVLCPDGTEPEPEWKDIDE